MEFPKLTMISRMRYTAGHIISAHEHDRFEAVLYVFGSGETVIGGKKYAFSAGDIAVINENVLHGEQHLEDAEVLFLRTLQCTHRIPDGVYRPANFPKLHKCALGIFAEFQSPSYGFTSLLAAKTEEFLVYLTRDIYQEKYRAETLSDAAEFLKEESLQKPDLSALAQSCGYRYESFRHVFKKVYGMSPYAFFLYHRLNRAGRMLSETEKTCTEIALECGFCDSAQFSKLFRAQFGMTPSEYRKCNG